VSRPVVGVSTWSDHVRWRVFDEELAFVEARFVTILNALGADCLLVPPQATLPERVLRELDAFVLSGGADIGSSPGRDATELGLARLAIELDRPLLGVCRGCQVLNVALGGTLVPHVPDRYAELTHSLYDPDAETFSFAAHEVRAVVGSPVAEACGERFRVLSSHHQAVDRLGDGLDPVAWSEDGLVEAICRGASRFAVGVQWHPEADDDERLFAALLDAVRTPAAAAPSPR
jgi:gamma-glutamyl-gamma-aminobutyrate hydrolase PuuD